jgi:DNA-binding MarR family transcriptional regulator
MGYTKEERRQYNLRTKPERDAQRAADRKLLLEAKKSEVLKARVERQKASAIVGIADPLSGTIAEIAEESGLSKSAAVSLVDMLRRKGLLLSRALGEVTKEETRQLFELRAHEILASITQEDIDDAPLDKKMIAAGIATDKALLLSGQPTQILSIAQLENLDKLSELLLTEMQRRGQVPRVLDGSDTVVLDINPPGQGDRRDPTRGSWAPSDEPA